MREQITTKRQVTNNLQMKVVFVKKLTETRTHEIVAIIQSIAVQNVLSSHSLYKSIKIRIHITIILPLVPYVRHIVRHIRERTQARECENKMLRKIFGSKKGEVTRDRKTVLSGASRSVFLSQNYCCK